MASQRSGQCALREATASGPKGRQQLRQRLQKVRQEAVARDLPPLPGVQRPPLTIPSDDVCPHVTISDRDVIKCLACTRSNCRECDRLGRCRDSGRCDQRRRLAQQEPQAVQERWPRRACPHIGRPTDATIRCAWCACQLCWSCSQLEGQGLRFWFGGLRDRVRVEGWG